MSLAIIATAFAFFVWIVGESALSPLWTATVPSMNEQGVQVSNGMRFLWIAFPVMIAVGLWIWAALVVTRRQVTTAGPYYFFKHLSAFRNDCRGIAQVVIVGGIALIIAGIFWIVVTMPVTQTIDSMGGVSAFAADAQNTILFMNLFVGAMPILAGIIIIAWSFTRTIEERETGISSL